MHQRSQISLCKFLSRYPFQRSSKPTSPFFSKSLSTLSNKWISNSPKKITPNFLHPKTSFSFTNSSIFQNNREYCADTNKVVDEINFKFAEAREEIEMALESKETVYFDEEAESARAAVKEVLDLFEGLLAKLPESEKGVLQRSMGLKIEQLKAELAQLNE
ncbi:hypothetical protein LguiA_018401 [Lonicera macranthoides]